jgi:hypothetical protein
MSNAKDPEFHELEPLEELHDLAPLEELEPLPDESAGSSAEDRGAPRAAGGASAPSAGGQEVAPLMLQKAALVLIFAALLPWLVPEGFNLVRLGAKSVILVGAWVLYCGVEFAHGGKTPLDGLGKAHKLALPIVGYLLTLVGIGLTMIAGKWEGMIEASALAVGVITWCQVHGYVRGGKFNPMMALVIPMFGLAGVLNVAVVLGLDVGGLAKALAILGSLGVAGAGGFGGYTMFLAMKEAKAHGEAKKRAAVEARAAERRKKGPGSGSARPA